MFKTRPATETDAPFIAWVMQEAARSHLKIGRQHTRQESLWEDRLPWRQAVLSSRLWKSFWRAGHCLYASVLAVDWI